MKIVEQTADQQGTLVLGRNLARKSIFNELPINNDLDSPEAKRFFQLKMAHVMDEVSRDLKLRDDSVELEILSKMYEAEKIMTTMEFGRLITKQTVVEEDYFDVLRTGLYNETEEILEHSFCVPVPEINLRFDDPFTDKLLWDLPKVIEICEVNYCKFSQN